LQVNRRVHVVSDPILRDNLKQQIDIVSSNVNILQREQRLMKRKYDDLKKDFKEAKDEEEKFKRELGKTTRQVTSQIASILRKSYIESRPYCHGGNYNGKAMVRLMDCSRSCKIMDEISTYLLSIPELDRIQKEEIDQ
jgi:hypothetical protein